MPSISTTTGSFITLSEAQTLVSNWINLQSSMSLAINESNPKAIAFGIDKLQQIIDQSGCVAVRVYNGYGQSKRNMIFVGVDQNNDDMTSGYILDIGMPCPDACPPSTSL